MSGGEELPSYWWIIPPGLSNQTWSLQRSSGRVVYLPSPAIKRLQVTRATRPQNLRARRLRVSSRARTPSLLLSVRKENLLGTSHASYVEHALERLCMAGIPNRTGIGNHRPQIYVEYELVQPRDRRRTGKHGPKSMKLHRCALSDFLSMGVLGDSGVYVKPDGPRQLD